MMTMMLGLPSFAEASEDEAAANDPPASLRAALRAGECRMQNDERSRARVIRRMMIHQT
jgi:hypothetical protein